MNFKFPQSAFNSDYSPSHEDVPGNYLFGIGGISCFSIVHQVRG